MTVAQVIKVMIDGPGRSDTELVAGREVVIGRARDADVRFDIPQMAERHLKIIEVDGKFEVHDLLGRYPVRTIRAHEIIRLFGIKLSFERWPPLAEPVKTYDEVRVADLLRDPSSFDNRRITTVGLWWYGFELSSFADAWLSCPDESTFGEGKHYVRVTGTWHAAPDGHYGHLGASDKCLAAKTVEVLPLEPTIELGPGELASRRASLEGELVAATVPLRLGHRLASLDGIPTSEFQFKHAERDPIEVRVRAVLWIERGTLTVLEHTRLSQPHPVAVPVVAGDELSAHTHSIVDVIGELRAGKYWPRIGELELVPPEITTTDQSAQEFCIRTPPPDELQRWQERLASGPIRIRARGYVDKKRFSAYRLDIRNESN